MSNSYYHQIVEITKDYLGPAAPRFINRQVEYHCEHDKNNLLEEDVRKIAEGVRVSLGLLSQDKKEVDAAYQRILNILKK